MIKIIDKTPRDLLEEIWEFKKNNPDYKQKIDLNVQLARLYEMLSRKIAAKVDRSNFERLLKDFSRDIILDVNNTIIVEIEASILADYCSILATGGETKEIMEVIDQFRTKYKTLISKNIDLLMYFTWMHYFLLEGALNTPDPRYIDLAGIESKLNKLDHDLTDHINRKEYIELEDLINTIKELKEILTMKIFKQAIIDYKNNLLAAYKLNNAMDILHASIIGYKYCLKLVKELGIKNFVDDLAWFGLIYYFLTLEDEIIKTIYNYKDEILNEIYQALVEHAHEFLTKKDPTILEPLLQLKNLPWMSTNLELEVLVAHLGFYLRSPFKKKD